MNPIYLIRIKESVEIRINISRTSATMSKIGGSMVELLKEGQETYPSNEYTVVCSTTVKKYIKAIAERISPKFKVITNEEFDPTKEFVFIGDVE